MSQPQDSTPRVVQSTHFLQQQIFSIKSPSELADSLRYIPLEASSVQAATKA
jgi:hypothetical protein